MVMSAVSSGRAWLLLLVLFAATVQAGVEARVDRQRLTAGESLQLTIRVTGSLSADAPDLDVLQRDFEVLGTSRNSSFSIGGGHRETATEWQIELMPRRSGTLEIPSLSVAGERTAAITVTVDGNAATASGTGDVRLEVDTDATDEIHVQQQLLLRVRILHAVDFSRGATLEPLVIDGAMVRELGERTFTKTVDSTRFAVFERSYAVFPQRSGELLIPSLGFRAVVGGGSSFFDPFGTRGRQARTISLHSAEKRLRVLPTIDNASPWLPASVLTLVETWDKDPQQLRAGDSVTRTLTLRAHGLTAAQLPPLPVPTVDGLRFYPDQPRLEDAPQDSGITGSRIESTAMIAERAGKFVLPPIELRWWDTVNRRFETALIPGHTLDILPPDGSAGSTVPARTPDAMPADAAPPVAAVTPPPATRQPASPSWPWMIATLLLTLTTLFSAWQWWRATRHRQTMPSPVPAPEHGADPDAALAAFDAACRSSDPMRIWTTLAAWGAAVCPQQNIRSAGDAVAAMQDVTLSAEYRRLLESTYGSGDIAFDADALCRIVTALHERHRCKHVTTDHRHTALPPLYAR